MQKIKTTGNKGTIKSYPLDLSIRESIDSFVANVQKDFQDIDILINNAGLIMTEGQPKKNSP